MKLRITCGLVVYNEITELQRLIPQLKFELKDYDIDFIFVLNHENKKIRHSIALWLNENLSDHLNYFENPSNNLGFARELILTTSPNELIYLTDPDIEILPGSIHQLIQLALKPDSTEQKYKTAGFGGAVVHQSKNVFINQTFQLMSRISRLLPFSFQIQNHSQIKAVDHLPSCHLLLKKSAAIMIGGFSYLQNRCGEDTDFTHRAFNLNYRFLFLPSSKVLHWQNMSVTQWLLKIFNFGRAQVRVQKINFLNGLRLYRLSPLLCLLITIGLCLYSKTLFFSLILGLGLSYFIHSALLGFVFVLLSYSLGELSELIWPFFESKNVIPLPELKANLTYQGGLTKLNDQLG